MKEINPLLETAIDHIGLAQAEIGNENDRYYMRLQLIISQLEAIISEKENE